MDFLQVYGYEVKDGKAGEYQQQLNDSADAWKAAMPDGTEYVGTYASIYSSEKQAGSFFTIYRLDSYAALDRLAEEQQSGELGRIVGRLMSYVDTDNNAGQSGFLLKSMTDVTITEA